MRSNYHKPNRLLVCTIAAITAIVLLLYGKPPVKVYASKISDLEEQIKKAKEEKQETQNKINANKE